MSLTTAARNARTKSIRATETAKSAARALLEAAAQADEAAQAWADAAETAGPADAANYRNECGWARARAAKFRALARDVESIA